LYPTPNYSFLSVPPTITDFDCYTSMSGLSTKIRGVIHMDNNSWKSSFPA